MTSVSDHRPLRGVALLFLVLVIAMFTYVLMTNWSLSDFNANFHPSPSRLKSVFSWKLKNETKVYKPVKPAVQPTKLKPSSPSTETQVYKPVTKPAVQSTKLRPSTEGQGQCLEGLDGMLDGYWEPKPMGPQDVARMKKFLKEAREVIFHMPPGLQRSDKLCGDTPQIKGKWFRALCDADGPTPCCFNNKCVAKTVQQCACPNCFDMRTELHAEYATWRTRNPSCQPLSFNKSELCTLLDNATIYFIGDSLVRHVHTALLMTMRDPDTGAFGDNMPKDKQVYCRGLNMFLNECRHLATDVRVCDGRVRILYRMLSYTRDSATLQNYITAFKNKPRTLVFVGLGFHDGLNSSATFGCIKPTLDKMAKERWKWPIVSWASVHKFGVLRNPNVRGQSAQVKLFNEDMKRRMTPYFKSLPLHVFNAFNLTAAVSSFDGQHYGLGVNKVKGNILMNFIHSLQERKLW